MINERNLAIINEFRANAGKVGGHFTGRTLLLLHTLGAKSKEERVNPAAYVRDGERYIISASHSGQDTNPNWYHNLVANPFVTIEVGTETFKAQATIVTAEPEYSRLYAKMVEMMPVFAEYQQKTKRVIPVIALTLIK